MTRENHEDESWWDEATEARMPGTVSKMTAPGGVIYLVGTAHGHRKSVRDVARVIRAVQPHAVCIEMCSSRVVFVYDDVTDAAKEEPPAAAGERRGEVVSEFLTAVNEVRRLRGDCMLHLIDRPIEITASRLVHALSVWDLLKFYWQDRTPGHSTDLDVVSDDAIDEFRRRGGADAQLAPFAAAYPQLHHVLVAERDLFMAFRLQQAALPDPRVVPPGESTRVVAVVGLGHVSGIQERFNLAEECQVMPLFDLPPPRYSLAVLAGGVLAAGVSLLAVGAFLASRVLADQP